MLGGIAFFYRYHGPYQAFKLFSLPRSQSQTCYAGSSKVISKSWLRSKICRHSLPEWQHCCGEEFLLTNAGLFLGIYLPEMWLGIHWRSDRRFQVHKSFYVLYHDVLVVTLVLKPIEFYIKHYEHIHQGLRSTRSVSLTKTMHQQIPVSQCSYFNSRINIV